jgi:CDP-diacylglycerol--glycerol-3-phosphate 3-phosphatidyltransferase
MFDGKLRAPVDRAVRPLGDGLRKTGITPDGLTAAGLLVAVVAAVVIASGGLRGGFVLVVLAAIPDLLDGAVAKASGTSSKRGAFFDSTADRVTDFLLLGGVAWYLAGTSTPQLAVLPFAVAGAGALVSYQRAKAESLGFEAKGGLMERAERLILLCAGLLFDTFLVPILWIMLVLTLITAGQRFVKVWRQASATAPIPERARVRRQRRNARVTARASRRSDLGRRRPR